MTRWPLGFVLLLAVFSGACSFQPLDNGNGAAPVAADRAATIAAQMVGKPYRYGGSSPQGFDCSGLVHYSYSRAGVKIPRDTPGLRQASRPVSVRHIQRGDLVFFNQEGKRASHVGIYLGNDEFVHAPSTGKHVHIVTLSESYWQRHFAGARRVEVY